jgi:hypothetical protein
MLGKNYLEHWIDAFQQAKYRSGFKWAVMWANHNRPGSHTKEDWIAVVNRWIGKYFNTDEYLQMDGKPVVFIWDTANLRRDLGGSEAAAEMLALADKMVREAGLKGRDVLGDECDKRRYLEIGRLCGAYELPLVVRCRLDVERPKLFSRLTPSRIVPPKPGPRAKNCAWTQG